MNVLAIGAILAIVLPVAFLTWSIVTPDRSARAAIEKNLGLLKAGPKHSTTSISEALTALSRRITPVGYTAWLDGKLAGAGRPRSWPLDRVLVAKPLLALLGLFLGILVLLPHPDGPRFLLLIALGVLFYFVPDILLNNSAQKRRHAMQLALPNMLDQMLISVEAGIGFEGAMARASESTTGPLSDEFVRTLQDIQVGRSRREAYTDLAARASFPDIRSFVRSIVQADQYGIAIAKVLKTQAQEMRLKRRQRAEEHAMKIPVKILFPLIFAILPAMFIIILGPAIMGIIKTFS
ncbi:type II secretion system F family protein [Sinomonas sp. ASV486]|uniref:type II secretion system F family protein n=1 Tax=Sinomonas sp. ASV486 TaxID=3051170 RepID=UPI0027DDA48C|nr:type II secretion system F family protein [Sinomonas sp. ASV486]MDQ4488795.1 type II secretion system F family protein [Sinomonas sp. ASV486]